MRPHRVTVERNDGARFLTDDQWVAIMRVVPDDERLVLRLPRWPGDSAKVIRDGRTRRIEPDGSVIDERV